MTIGGEKGQHQHYEQNFFSRFRTRQTRKQNEFFPSVVDQNSTIHVSSLSLFLFIFTPEEKQWQQTQTQTQQQQQQLSM